MGAPKGEFDGHAATFLGINASCCMRWRGPAPFAEDAGAGATKVDFSPQAPISGA